MENSTNIYKMTKTVTYIDCPNYWQSAGDYSSHRPLLFLALNNINKGVVIEFGSGDGSTNLMERLCRELGHKFISYETNTEWGSKYPSVRIIDNYDNIKLSEGEYKASLLFIDSAPGEQRKELIAKHSNNADVIVIHDSEKSSQFCYDLEPTLLQFEYRLDYEPEGNPHTTIISRKINVCDWV